MLISKLTKISNKKEFISELIYMLLGSFFLAIAVNVFLLPNQITTGGATGLGTILYYTFKVPVSVTIVIINIPLYIIAIKELGIKFAMKSIITTSIYTAFLSATSKLAFLSDFNIDIIISCIFGGILTGLGVALVFKAGASSGGTDLLASIIRKHNKGINISKIMLGIDGILILTLALVLKNFNICMYSIIAIYISNKIIDIVFEGAEYTKVVNIITENKTIPSKINELLERGATVTNAVGAYTNNNQSIITCIVTLPEIAKLKKIVYDIDKHALMYVVSANEVIGYGFKEYK